MLTYAAALFGISPGTVNGLTRRGPRCPHDLVLLQQDVHAADTGADVDPDAPRIVLCHVEAGVSQRLFRCRDGEVKEAIHAARILFADI